MYFMVYNYAYIIQLKFIVKENVSYWFKIHRFNIVYLKAVTINDVLIWKIIQVFENAHSK